MPQAMGYPRDKCHAVSTAGSCSAGKIGDGNWDRNAYFYVNYNWGSADWPGYTSTATNPLPSNPTRYQVRSEEHTSELQSLMRISYAVFCLKKKKNRQSDCMTTH